MEDFEINVASITHDPKGASKLWFARVYTPDGRGYQDVVAHSLVELVQVLVDRKFLWLPVQGQQRGKGLPKDA